MSMDILDRLRSAPKGDKTAHVAADEIERLRVCLSKANEQAEHFEREWYLRGDELEQLRAELAQVTAQRDAILMQARIWSGEAKAQKATVDAVGEILGGVPDWGPIAKGVEQLRAELAASREREARMREAGQRLLDAIEHDTQIHRFSILWDGLRAALAEGAQG